MSQFNKYLEIVQEAYGKKTTTLEKIDYAIHKVENFIDYVSGKIGLSTLNDLKLLVEFVNEYYDKAKIHNNKLTIVLNRDMESMKERKDYGVIQKNLQKLQKQGYITNFDFRQEETSITLDTSKIENYLNEKLGNRAPKFKQAKIKN